MPEWTEKSNFYPIENSYLLSEPFLQSDSAGEDLQGENRVDLFQCYKYQENNKNGGNDETCSICKYILEDSVMELDCKHRFHEICARNALAQLAKCATCRLFVKFLCVVSTTITWLPVVIYS